jgi:hypothetical protein
MCAMDNVYLLEWMYRLAVTYSARHVAGWIRGAVNFQVLIVRVTSIRKGTVLWYPWGLGWAQPQRGQGMPLTPTGRLWVPLDAV